MVEGLKVITTTLSAERVTLRPVVDIAVYAKNDLLQLVVEVKNKTAATTDWAARMRRNLIAHLDIPSSPYFLLALPDHFYLWRRVPSLLAIVPPDYDIVPAPLLAPYVGDGGRSLSSISESGLILVVSSWLTDLVASDLDMEKIGGDQAWLVDSGLYSVIAGGVIRQDVR